MIDRLGHVLYWAGCGIAIIVAIGGIAIVAASERNPQAIGIVLTSFGLCAAACWLAGRACLYVFSGK